MSNEFKLVLVALLEHIESLKKQLQESAAQTAPLQAEIERLKETVEDSTQIILQQGDSVKQLKALLVLANAALEGRIDAPLSKPADALIVKLTGPQEWLEELAKAAQPADQRGEPVAWVECSPAWLKSGGDCATAPRMCVGRHGISHLHPSHTQPATVKVVLPEHQDSDLRSPVYGYARGWNACIDEVKKLNNYSK